MEPVAGDATHRRYRAALGGERCSDLLGQWRGSAREHPPGPGNAARLNTRVERGGSGLRGDRWKGRKYLPPPLPPVPLTDDPPTWWACLWLVLLAVAAGFGVGELVWVFLRFLAGK